MWPPPIDIDTDGNYVPDLLEEVPSAENGGLVVDEDGVTLASGAADMGYYAESGARSSA